MAYFQLPLNMLGVPIMLLTLGFIIYGVATNAAELVTRLVFIKGYLWSLFYIPSLKEWILSQNIRIIFPLFVGGIAAAYMFIVAHKQVKEKLFFPLSIWAYFVCLPFLVAYYWFSALTQEIFRAKKKW